ncbi:hypothetical protein CI610_01622 [invertebrate metagenome]|uniref:Nudix hydrolase domain-containing protein n=1 Tax=invertebrate metagenome TaxID=1711999 RepID=A0A2H9T837_9ZZZZ
MPKVSGVSGNSPITPGDNENNASPSNKTGKMQGKTAPRKVVVTSPKKRIMGKAGKRQSLPSVSGRKITVSGQKTHARAGDNTPEGYNRIKIPVSKVSWTVPFKLYKPTEFTAEKILKQPVYADPVDPAGIDWNSPDRQSHIGKLRFDGDRPLNPKGRTGTSGRGVLGKWGANHAADPIITRQHNGKLELLVIQRRDTDQWALPGGMKDPEDAHLSTTAIRELVEEALNPEDVADVRTEAFEKVTQSLPLSLSENKRVALRMAPEAYHSDFGFSFAEAAQNNFENLKQRMSNLSVSINIMAQELMTGPRALTQQQQTELFGLFQERAVQETVDSRMAEMRQEKAEMLRQMPAFAQAKAVYQGYVDDRRNTDNAWMETSAFHVHLDDPSFLTLSAGDDAKAAKWMEVNQKNLSGLYASHADIVQKSDMIRSALKHH